MEPLAAASVAVSSLCLVLAAGLCLAVFALRYRLEQCVDSRGMLRRQSWHSGCETEETRGAHGLFSENGHDENQDAHMSWGKRIADLHEQLRCSTDAILLHGSEMEKMVERISNMETQLRKRRAECTGVQVSMDASDDTSVCTPEVWRNHSWLVSPSSMCPTASSFSSVQGSAEPPAFSPVAVVSPSLPGLQVGDEEEEEGKGREEEEERTRAFLVGYLTQKRIDRLSRRFTNEMRALPCAERSMVDLSDEQNYARPALAGTTVPLLESPFSGCNREDGAQGVCSTIENSPRISSPVVESLTPLQVASRCHISTEVTSKNGQEASAQHSSNVSSTNSIAQADAGRTNGGCMDALVLARQRSTPLHMIKVRADIGFVDGALRTVQDHADVAADEHLSPSGAESAQQRRSLPLLEVSEGLCSPVRAGEEEEVEETPSAHSSCAKVDAAVSREEPLLKACQLRQDLWVPVSEREGACGPDGGGDQGAGDWYIVDLQITEDGIAEVGGSDKRQASEYETVRNPCCLHGGRKSKGSTGLDGIARIDGASMALPASSQCKDTSDEHDEYDSDYLASWE